MRGIYSAAYLDSILTDFAKARKGGGLDFGKGFSLLCGTSTGAIVACALAKGVNMAKVVSLYRDHGPSIFPKKVPENIAGAIQQSITRSVIGGNE